MAILMKHYANLHMHSTHSDGRYTPEELARIAKELGYGAIALTDHDTVTGNAPMKAECDRLGLECIYGAEFCARFGTTGHVLHTAAFHFDAEHPKIQELISRMATRYAGITMDLFDIAVKNGQIKGISWDEVLELNPGIRWLTGNHVFSAMKAKGLLSTDEEKIAFLQSCFGTENKKALPKKDRPGFINVEEYIPIIHEAGGIVLVAHPHNQLTDVKLLTEIGIDGLEVWHSELPAPERREALKLAMEHDLYVSGGDDHSGLLGGQYYRFEHPEETKYYFPARTLGTTQYFFEEIRDMKKKPDRKEVMRELLENDELWQKTGGIIDDIQP